MKEMPDPIPEVPCMCAGSMWVPTAEDCMCEAGEAALRAWQYGKAPVPMTPEQRQWCMNEIRSVGDSTSQPDNFDNHTDADLGRDTIHAWADYCRDKGLL